MNPKRFRAAGPQNWMTLEEAIKDAQSDVSRGFLKVAYIVEAIQVIRKADAPIIQENFK